jgi:hypothetical protein
MVSLRIGQPLRSSRNAFNQAFYSHATLLGFERQAFNNLHPP